MNRPYITHADSYASWANEISLKEKRIQLLEASLRDCAAHIAYSDDWSDRARELLERAEELVHPAQSEGR